MTRYLISFDDGAMTIPDEELPAVVEAGHALVREAEAAGVWVLSGGLMDYRQMSVVDTDGKVTHGPYPGSKSYIGGFSIVDVASLDEALEWAARIAAVCRCAQEVREFVPDPRS